MFGVFFWEVQHDMHQLTSAAPVPGAGCRRRDPSPCDLSEVGKVESLNRAEKTFRNATADFFSPRIRFHII